MEDIEARYIDTRLKVREKLKRMGYDESLIEIKIHSLDLDFMRHLWINGKDFTKDDVKGRVAFYLRFLEAELDYLY